MVKRWCARSVALFARPPGFRASRACEQGPPGAPGMLLSIQGDRASLSR